MQQITQEEFAEHLLERLDTLYQESRKRYDSDPVFKKEADEITVKLQNGDPSLIKQWKMICGLTIWQNQHLYNSLNVGLSPADIRGESFYSGIAFSGTQAFDLGNRTIKFCCEMINNAGEYEHFER